MSNKTQLQTNNTNLDALIMRVNAAKDTAASLPEIGPGGGDTSIEDSLVTRTVSTYTNDRVRTIGDDAFYNCSRLTFISFPAATTIGSSAFRYCSSLTSVSFPVATTIGSNAFYNCSRLTSIYLTGSKLCKLSNSNAFSKTEIWSNKGSIFVPSSLVASYKKATNWVFFSNRIFGI